jgi:hypothetical protein
MSTILSEIIKNEMTVRGIERYKLRTYNIYVSEPIWKEEFHNEILVFVSNIIDLPITSRVKMVSPDGNFVTSPEELKNMVYAKHRFFSNQLEVTTENYGTIFTGYRLEFLRIKPESKSSHCKY